MKERTLAIIKPDAVEAKNAGKIIDMIEAQNFDIIRMEKKHVSKGNMEKFYAVHQGKPFFDELVQFMISGPVILMVLEKENAVKAWRDLMGATNPANAAEGTIRKKFAKDIGKNAVHGSDSVENAVIEIKHFFPDLI
jgi:nucleoside-diphosphate kinase